MHHHIGDGELAQIEDAADHISVFALDTAFLVMQGDGAADFFVRRFGGFTFTRFDAEQKEHAPNQPLDRRDDGRQHPHDLTQGGGHGQCEAIGAGDGKGLGQDLDKHQDGHRHYAGGHRHGAVAELRFQKLCRQRGRQTIDEGVAQQQGADDFFAVRDQAVDVAGGPAAVFFQLMHPAAADGGQRGLRA